jgi:hypothetical protein
MSVHKFLRRNREAAATASWFFGDFVLRYKYELAFITALSAAATAIQAFVLVALNQLVAGGTAVTLLQWIKFSHSPTAFVALLSLSGLFTYLSGKRTLALWPRYQGHALNCLFSAVQDSAIRNFIDLKAISGSGLLKALQDTQRLGAFSRLVTKTILPALRFLAFFTYAMVANPIATLIAFAIVAPISGATLLFCSRKAAQCDRNAESIARESSKQLQECLSFYFDSLVASNSCAKDLGANSAISQRTVYLVNRFVWVERARFATTLATISMLGGLVAFAGMTGDTNWIEFLIYILSLLFAFSQLSNLTSSISTFGYFYPTVARHRKMILALRSSSIEDFYATLRQSFVVVGAIQEEDVFLE